VLAPLACGLIGAAIERYGLRHVHPKGHVAEILFTFGLAYLIEELVTDAVGPQRGRQQRARDHRFLAVHAVRHELSRPTRA
jgi:branched-subunit amino acid ABC-type transport system permease component